MVNSTGRLGTRCGRGSGCGRTLVSPPAAVALDESPHGGALSISMDCLRRGDGESWLSRLGGRIQSSASITMLERQVAGHLDLDVLGKSFGRFAGADQLMDPEEFERFTKQANITREHADSLWSILDRDGSGMVDRGEFQRALDNLQKARAWSRYCPECVYDNTCNFCQECNANCDQCTQHCFCATHWADHPARNSEAAGAGSGISGASVNTAELLREQLIIRPLQWAYSSAAMSWLPVAHKAALRRALRSHQLASQEAARRAKLEEEAAHQAR